MDALDDPGFLKRVGLLMQDERVVETFSVFDSDGSGAISINELRPLVHMMMPSANAMVVEEMVKNLDINLDGEVDLWEFCIAIQKRNESAPVASAADIKAEIDAAFELFGTGPDATIGEAELRSVMQDPVSKSTLSNEEFSDMLADLDRFGMSVKDGRRVRLQDLRMHPSFRA